MGDIIRPLGHALTQLPTDSAADGRNDGFAFEMHYLMGNFVPWREPAWALLRERTAFLAEKCTNDPTWLGPPARRPHHWPTSSPRTYQLNCAAVDRYRVLWRGPSHHSRYQASGLAGCVELRQAGCKSADKPACTGGMPIALAGEHW